MIRLRFLFLLTALSLILAFSASAQNRGCATVENHQRLQAEFPTEVRSNLVFERWMDNKKRERQAINVMTGEITIPVVVHVIHNGDAVGANENISDAQILSQIQVLNEDFGKMSGSRGYNDLAIGADTKIEWCLAKIDPNGNPTTGINRVDLGVADWTDVAFDATAKPATQWDPSQYCNVWVANLSGGILGYAQFPEASGLQGMPNSTTAITDGVVMTADAFGTADADDGTFNLNPTYNLGRTMTHEIGHWLGLRHTWGDDVCGVDDFVADTPESDAPNFDCATHSSCGSVDMIENYMDYTNDACMNIFTHGQKARIDVVMSNSPRRKELVNSNKCSPLTEISFFQSAALHTENTTINDGCLGYQDISVQLRISSEPTAPAFVELSSIGSAVLGEDFDFVTPTSLVFLANSNESHTVILRIYDDANTEIAESIQLSYSIATIGDAVAGSYNQTYTLSIIDNDTAPLNAGPARIFYSEDFATGIPTDWNNLELATGGGSWSHANNGPNNWAAFGFTGAQPGFTTAANGFMLFDSDGKGDDGAIEDTELISAAIDCSAQAGVTLQFEQHFVKFQNDITSVGVSRDGVNFTMFPINDGMANNTFTDNPDLVKLDISAIADGQSTIYLKFKYQGDRDYWWTFDDVALVGNGPALIQEAVNIAAPTTEYLGPNGTVHFYDPTTGNIMMTLENLSAHNFGCTTVSINRAGNSAMEAWDPTVQNYIASKTFSVSPEFNSPTGTYKVTLYYTEAELLGWAATTGRSISELSMVKTKADITNPMASDVREFNALSNKDYGFDFALTSSFSSGFSDFGVGPDAVLPIELLSFDGLMAPNGVLLQWKTLTEINSSYFELQQSKNGIDFVFLNRIAAAGNTKDPQAYQYLDHSFTIGNNYYRLKMIDQDDSFSYSNIAVVKAKGGTIEQIKLFPNPAIQTATLSLYSEQEQTVTISVSNTIGQMVIDKTATISTGVNMIQLDLAAYEAGIYFVEMIDEEGRRNSFRLIKK